MANTDYNNFVSGGGSPADYWSSLSANQDASNGGNNTSPSGGFNNSFSTTPTPSGTTGGSGGDYNSFISGGGSPYDWYNQQSQGGAGQNIAPQPMTGIPPTPSSIVTPGAGGPSDPSMAGNPGLGRNPGYPNYTGPSAILGGNLNRTPPGTNFVSDQPYNQNLGTKNLNYVPPTTAPTISDQPFSGLNGLRTQPLPGSLPKTVPTPVPPTAPTSPVPPPVPPTGLPPTNPFGTSPFLPNPTGTGPNGQYNFNPTYFPTLATANTVAGMSGGTVTPNANGLLSAPASPFTQNQPSNYVTLPNGTVINPGNIANDYATYNDPSQTNLLQRLVNGELTGQGEGNVGYNPALASQGTPIPNYTGPQSITPYNAFLGGVKTDINNPATLLTGFPQQQAASTATPATPAGPIAQQAQQTPSGQSIDPAQLQSILSFLQAYSGLGSGAGNPTSVNQNGQLGSSLGSMISQILSGVMGDQSLYSRQRQYPQLQ